MKRRNFLIGSGSTAIGAGALIGSGAFSRVESQRDVTVEIAEDPDAYLGLDACGSLNGDNFAEIGDDGHLFLDFGDNGNDGEGVNSDSRTWFDNVIQICNQGKAEANVYINSDALEDDENYANGAFYEETTLEEEEVDAVVPGGERRLDFYEGIASGSQGDDEITSIVGQGNAVTIPLGDCICIGVRTNTKEIAAPDTLFDGTVTIKADSPEAGEIVEENGNG